MRSLESLDINRTGCVLFKRVEAAFYAWSEGEGTESVSWPRRLFQRFNGYLHTILLLSDRWLIVREWCVYRRHFEHVPKGSSVSMNGIRTFPGTPYLDWKYHGSSSHCGLDRACPQEQMAWGNAYLVT